MEFKEYKLDDITKKIYSGGTPSTKEAAYWNGNLKWLSSGETSNRFIISTEKTITQKGAENSSTKLAFKHDLVMASAGQGYTRGQTSFLKIDTYINQSLIAISVNKDEIHPLYLFYNLVSRYEELRQISDSSSIRGSINTKMIKNLNITIPEKSHQNRIVYLISSIDEKIEVNKKIIANLEELSQTLFKRWFVDFEFPDENGNPYKSSGGEMIDSELGEIPERWSLGNFENLGKIVGGGTPSKKVSEYYTKQKEIPWITPKDLSKNKNTYIYHGEQDITELGLNKSSAKLINKDSVLFSSRAPIGYIAIAGQEVTTNQGFKSIEVDKNINPYYVFFLLKYKLPIIEQTASGSTFKEISGKGMKSIPIILPIIETINKYGNIVESYFEKIKVLEKENQKLIQLRNTLLPKLMSGEIEIPDDIEVNKDELSI